MQNKILVIYKSSTGFTKRYAEMIAEEIECKLADYRTVTEEMLSGYDIVVFGSRAHAGMIDGYGKAGEMFRKCGAGKMVLFVTGATPNAAEDVISEFWKRNLTAEELENVPHFYMQSGLCYEKMTFTDRLMMKVFAAMMKRKKDKTTSDRELERAISGSYDISSNAYVEPLVTYLKNETENIEKRAVPPDAMSAGTL